MTQNIADPPVEQSVRLHSVGSVFAATSGTWTHPFDDVADQLEPFPLRNILREQLSVDEDEDEEQAELRRLAEEAIREGGAKSYEDFRKELGLE